MLLKLKLLLDTTSDYISVLAYYTKLTRYPIVSDQILCNIWMINSENTIY